MATKYWYRLTSEKVAQQIKTDIQSGLTRQEAEKRQQHYGPNALPKAKLDSWLWILLRQFHNAFLYLLMAAAVLKFFLEGYRDAIIIVVIILVNGIIGAIQEGKAQSILASLQEFITTKAIVIRDREKIILDEHALVPGDIIVVQEGSRVPADVRIIESSLLKVDEAMLTGESSGVKKTEEPIEQDNLPPHDQTNMLFMGTHIISGNGTAIVVATGLDTEIGQLKKTIEHIPTDLPLQKDLARLSKIIIGYSVILSVALFFIGIYLGKDPETMLFTLTSLFVAVVPESIPVIATIVLAVGAYRMAQSNVLIKRLPAIEALGRVDVLVVDKTGTLTRNEQTVSEIFIDDKLYTVTGRGYYPEGKVFLDSQPITEIPQETPLWYLGLAAALLDHSELTYDQKRNKFTLKGEPIHAALGILSKKLGFERKEVQKQCKQVAEIPFTSETRTYTAFYVCENWGLTLLSGSPEEVMQRCAHISEKTERAFAKMLEEGLRIIALAYKTHPETDSMPSEEQEVNNLTLLGLIGMQDALRENVKTTVQTIQDAGLQIVMATGDHKKTALYVGREANIFHEGDEVLEGKDFRKLDHATIDAKLPNTTVLARVTPQEKLDIIAGFHRAQKHVAMTGDGVNDAPALVAADVGMAMGIIGSEVAQDAADIVLLDDSLQSIVNGITQGRHILRTLRCVVFYLFTTNMSEFLIIAVSIFLRLPLPLLATQILWENLVTDGFLDIGLSLEPMERGILRTKNNQKLFDKKSIGKLIFMGSVMAVGTLGVFIYYYQTNLPLARTMALVTLSVFQWFNAWNMRSETTSVFAMNPFSNLWLVGLTVFVIIAQIAAVYVPIMQYALHLVPIDWHHWMIACIVGSSILFAEELRKLVANRRRPTS